METIVWDWDGEDGPPVGDEQIAALRDDAPAGCFLCKFPEWEDEDEE
ncbi:MAG: hypothetical protein ACRD4P_00260 [Bryobacteraceae bacterium]